MPAIIDEHTDLLTLWLRAGELTRDDVRDLVKLLETERAMTEEADRETEMQHALALREVEDERDSAESRLEVLLDAVDRLLDLPDVPAVVADAIGEMAQKARR